MFPKDVPTEIGTPFVIDEGNGEHRMYWIAAINDDRIDLQQNHPLAGQQVRFWVNVLSVRPATEQEILDGVPQPGLE